MRLRNPEQLVAHGMAAEKGGGGGKPKLVKKPEPKPVKPQPKPKPVPILQMPAPKIPPPYFWEAPTPPPPPPPATESRDEVDQAVRDKKRQVQRRRSFLASTFAGETGGYKPPKTVGSQSTLG